VPETDSVLTTTEVQQLLQLHGVDLDTLAEVGVDSLLGGQSLELAGMPGGSGFPTSSYSRSRPPLWPSQ
jgi:iron only hydrogenase large subunit-like protein